MGACRFNIAEQEWKESWEPTLRLVASTEHMIKFAARTGKLDDAWTYAERRLDYMVRLMCWVIKARSEGAAVCTDCELSAAIEVVEQLVRQVTGKILQGTRDELKGHRERAPV